MKRLLRVSFDIFISSFTAIFIWFIIGLLFDSRLTNVFTLTYPLQCLMGIIVSIFGVGANVCVYRDKKTKSADNGIFYGIVVSIILYGLFLLNVRKYISFMHMDYKIYYIFCIYSIIQILLQTILELVVSKLYYLEKNKEANIIVVMFNVLNIITITLTSLIWKNKFITSVISIIILLIYVILILIKYFGRIDFKLNLKNCFKYDSVSCSTSIMYFIIYLFGFSNSFAFGEKYVIAITFATLITDIQWDVTYAINNVAKIDIVKNKFDYEYHFKNACKLILILIVSILLMGIVLYPIYKPVLWICIIFVLLHISDFMLTPFINIKMCYLEMEVSASKTSANTLIAYFIRMLFSFIKTPFCTIIGQMCSTIYEFVYAKINYKVQKN